MLGHQADRPWQDALVARHLVGDGWRDLVERAVGHIADVIAAAPSARLTTGRGQREQATLWMHWSGTGLTKAAENGIADAVALAEGRSACKCETCGNAGRLYRVGRQL